MQVRNKKLRISHQVFMNFRLKITNKFIKVFRCFAVFFLVFFSYKTAYSDTNLKLGILLESLDEGASKCNIEKQSLIASMKLILRQNHIIVTNEANYTPFLYTSLNIMPIDKFNCIGKINVSVVSFENKKIHGGFSSKYMDSVYLCEKSLLLAYSKINFSKETIDGLEILIKNCLSDLEY